MAMPDPLDESIQYLKGVGPARAADFSRLGINTIRDLIFTFPRDISDRSIFKSISDAPEGENVSFIVRPVQVSERRVKHGRMLLTKAAFTDDTGHMEAVWFNSPWVAEKLQTANQIMLFGKTKIDDGLLKIDHPQFEVINDESDDPSVNIGRIVPLYPCTGKLTQNVWRKVMNTALESHANDIADIHCAEFLLEKTLPDRRWAVRTMHFPEKSEDRDRAHARLVYDECLLMQLAILMARRHHQSDLPGRQFRVSSELDSRIRKLLPFRLTKAQSKTVAEIVADMESPLPMHRLLQGDVGSGKTVVALYAMLAAVACKSQVCIMAPTSLLARQHFNTIASFLANSSKARVKLSLLVGGAAKNERGIILSGISSGAIDILIATHSAFQKDVNFKDLGLVVIDEQHKFGVSQRSALVSKGVRPDTLVMTATPIPRSLALTVYGDLDVSVIDELPPGRKSVKTTAIVREGEPEAWAFVRKELTKGRQAYVVSPLVDESEKLDLKSATEAFEELNGGALYGYKLALLHGKMKRDEQSKVVDAFRRGDIDVLVSTVVIEVGVDIPNANTMVVLHAERFGLAQLHQLRGRIGRGSESGYFFLFNEAKTEDAQRRLAVLEQTSDGFKIAEEDLLIRGPGEFLGTRQHGLPEFKLMDIIRDLTTIREARKDAENILQKDCTLTSNDYCALGNELLRLVGKHGAEAGIG